MPSSAIEDHASLGPPRLILASASPRRSELLREAGYLFTVVPAGVDETQAPAGLSPSDTARHLAKAKATAVAAQHRDALTLAADTLVSFGEQVIGKAEDADDARRILRLLSGTIQIVITGVCLAWPDANVLIVDRVMSAVQMRRMSLREIDAYVACGQWEGKAGAYGIQDNDPFVTRIGGSHSNIVGLPMEWVSGQLSAFGVRPGAEG